MKENYIKIEKDTFKDMKYDVTVDIVGPSITELYDSRNEIYVGTMTIREGIGDGKIWIENEEGEGGDFPVRDVENLLMTYFNRNF